MFALHKPHTAVEGNATVYGIQMDYFDLNILLPETYSWCVYSLQVECTDEAGTTTSVNVAARRDDFKYNGLSHVQPDECFEDMLPILNDPGANEQWTASGCLGSDGAITCVHPRPLIKAWYQPDACTAQNWAWTLNDPAITYPRFFAITMVGVVATALGCGGMCTFWLGKGCPDGDDY